MPCMPYMVPIEGNPNCRTKVWQQFFGFNAGGTADSMRYPSRNTVMYSGLFLSRFTWR